MDILYSLVLFISTLVGAYFVGKRKGKNSAEEKARIEELDKAKEVLEVRSSANVSDALERLSRNGKLDSLPPDTPERQLKLPL